MVYYLYSENQIYPVVKQKPHIAQIHYKFAQSTENYQLQYLFAFIHSFIQKIYIFIYLSFRDNLLGSAPSPTPALKNSLQMLY